jgi:hypothetical protein
LEDAPEREEESPPQIMLVSEDSEDNKDNDHALIR